MNPANLDPETTKAIAWTACIILGSVFGYSAISLISILKKLTENDIRNGMRIDSLEKAVFPENQKRKTR
jgi:hypothetical protein